MAVLNCNHTWTQALTVEHVERPSCPLIVVTVLLELPVNYVK
jgi:hypothetical protein